MSHLVSISKEISLFLNNINEYLPRLINEIALSIINNPKILDDIHSIIIYGNQSLYLEKWVHLYLQKLNNTTKLNLFNRIFQSNSENIDYVSSLYHFEFDYSDKYIALIKSIINNDPISSNPYVWLIKNIDRTSKNYQYPLSRIIDKSENSRYIFTSTNLSLIDKSLISRSLLINLSFNIDKMWIITKEIINDENLAFSDFKQSYYLNDNHILNLLSKSSHNILHDKYLNKLLIIIEKGKKNYDIINSIRQYCYKIYHLNIPFNYIAKYIINHYSQHESIHKIVTIFAEQESILKKCNKQLFAYEKSFIELSLIIAK